MHLLTPLPPALSLSLELATKPKSWFGTKHKSGEAKTKGVYVHNVQWERSLILTLLC